jgi:predicted nucleic acid-binding protein
VVGSSVLRLLDTDIMVDLLRGYPPAVNWLASLTGDAPGLPGFVVMELIMGCRNKSEMSLLLARVRPFRVFWPAVADYQRALVSLANGRLSHNMGPFDALIGECAVGLGALLLTFNTKHFKAISGLATAQPYPKP